MLGGFPGHQSEINTGIIQHPLAALNSLFHLNVGSLSLSASHTSLLDSQCLQQFPQVVGTH